jgi:hypothetical protein
MSVGRRTRAGDFVAGLWERVHAGLPVTIVDFLPHDATKADYSNYNHLWRWLHNRKWEPVQVGLTDSHTYYKPGTAPPEGSVPA